MMLLPLWMVMVLSVLPWVATRKYGFCYGSISIDATGYRITSQEDADQLSLHNCSHYGDSIIISTNSTTSISLRGVVSISGNLEVSNSITLSNFSGPDLQEQTGNLTLRNLQALSEVNLPHLHQTGGLVLQELPMLETIGIPNGLIGFFDSTGDLFLDISNTSLRDLVGINATGSEGIRIIGNHNLRELDLGTFTEAATLDVADNGDSASLNLSSLSWARSIRIEGVGSADLSSLAYMSSEVTITGLVLQNNSFVKFDCPNLSKILGVLTIKDCPNLTKIGFPELAEVEFLTIENNSVLQVVDGLNKLDSINEYAELTGNFSSVSLPSLGWVEKSFYLDSSNSNFDCSRFDKYHQDPSKYSYPRSYTCRASKTISGKDTAIHWHKPLTVRAKIDISIGVVAGVVLIGVLIWWGQRIIANRKKLTPEPKATE